MSEDKYSELELKFIAAATAFYSGEKLLMNDKEYDEMEKEILKVNPTFDIKRIILSSQAGKKVAHHVKYPSVKAKSTNKLTYDQLTSIYEDRSYILPKYDGCSIVAYYRDGEPYQILTRSTDTVGVDQTGKLLNKVLHNIDPKIDVVFYEAVVNKIHGDRAKANGLINSKYMQSEVDAKLSLIPFGCTSDDVNSIHDFMKNYTSEVSPKDFESIISTGFNSDGIPCDGVVVNNPTLNSIYIMKIHNNGEATTRIRAHSLNFSGVTGTYAPVINIQPVKVDGANLSNVKMGPYATIKSKHLGLGAEVVVVRKNKVIPYITKVITPSDDFNHILTCPKCSSPMTTLGSDLICTSESCLAKNRWMLNRICNVVLGNAEASVILNASKMNIKDIKELITVSPDIKSKFESINSIGIDQLVRIFNIPRFNSKTIPNRSKVDDEIKSVNLIDKSKILRKYLTSALQVAHFNYITNVVEYIFRELSISII